MFGSSNCTAKFHNGADFTAEDVAYTLDRVPTVPNSPGSYAIYVKSIVRAEIVDPLTIRLHTNGVYPLLPVDLTQVAIIWHGLGPTPATEDFNNGKNAIGTGPFRLVSYKPGDRTEMRAATTATGAEQPALAARQLPGDLQRRRAAVRAAGRRRAVHRGACRPPTPRGCAATRG